MSCNGRICSSQYGLLLVALATAVWLQLADSHSNLAGRSDLSESVCRHFAVQHARSKQTYSGNVTLKLYDPQSNSVAECYKEGHLYDVKLWVSVDMIKGVLFQTMTGNLQDTVHLPHGISAGPCDAETTFSQRTDWEPKDSVVFNNYKPPSHENATLRVTIVFDYKTAVENKTESFPPCPVEVITNNTTDNNTDTINNATTTPATSNFTGMCNKSRYLENATKPHPTLSTHTCTIMEPFEQLNCESCVINGEQWVCTPVRVIQRRKKYNCCDAHGADCEIERLRVYRMAGGCKCERRA